ncbi:MAG: NAD(P)/FAD-dependent oxidoreductase, partial [Acidimicrobiales bacterium]|nr:NAD(P)/FAD-dependent oxidoreductase [Acidimicrobiales bacterium]
MRLDMTPEPLADDDATIRAHLEGLPVVALLTTVAHATGDLSLLREDLRPDLTKMLAPDDGYDATQLETARRLAADALARHRDAGSPPPPPLSEDQLRAMVLWANGGQGDADMVLLLEEELCLDGADLRAPTWTVDDLAPDRQVTVAVIGAGMSGIVAAHRLRQAGVGVTIIEKNTDVGGTWLENAYPGCRVDIQNHWYSYSFAQSSHWPQLHSTQPVLLDYFRTCVDQLGLRDIIRFDTEVLEARWDDDDAAWTLSLQTPDGTSTERFDAVVSAVGQLNQPLMPDIDGIDTFAGPWFHSARWDHDVDLAGKDVAVIGTGASAVQFIPHVAEVAAEVTVYQRTPPWLMPVPNYCDDVTTNEAWILRHLPTYAQWDRLRLFTRTQEGLLPLAEVDPGWESDGSSVSALNDMMRQVLTAYYEASFPDAELRDKLLPRYPPTAKRVVLDNGIYPRTLARDDVTLETTTIDAVTPGGVRTADGVEHSHDVIIYGTGFQASKFLTPMRVIGTGGADLHERWGGDARAYVGITVPEFPNLFLMYGPNTNIVINGSIIY